MAVEKKILAEPALPKVFAEVVSNYIAGKPQDDSINWIGLKPTEIQNKLEEKNHKVSPYIIGELIKNAGLKKRSYLKDATAKEVPLRNEQFEKIADLKKAFMDAGLPVLSMDVKHKELLGNFFRDGKYEISGEGKSLSSDENVAYLAALCADYPILSIEDGCDEDDWDGWAALTAELGDKVQAVADQIEPFRTALEALDLLSGAPQKAMYLSADPWHRTGVLKDVDVQFNNAGGVLFGVDQFYDSGQHPDEAFAH